MLSSSPARFAGCRSSGLGPLPLAANRPLPVAADRVDSTHAGGCRSTGVLMVLLCKVPQHLENAEGQGPAGAVGATEVATVTRDWSNWCAVNVQTTPGLAVVPTVGKTPPQVQVSPIAIYATFCAELLSTA